MRIAWVSFDAVGRACLLAAAESGAEVAAVVTLPGPIRPERSGQCSFADAAASLGAELVETDDVNDRRTLAALEAAAPQMIFVVGWSQLVRDELISLAPRGVFGMHPTLLPRHRGRAPVPWTILSGLAVTGVTLFEITDATADSGPIVGQIEVPVEPDDTASTLYDRIAEAHVGLVRESLPALFAGTAPRVPQDPRRASAWPKRTPADGIMDWCTRAPYLHDWVRAQTRPYPGAFTFLGERRITVWQASPAPLPRDASAGAVVAASERGVLVACGEGGLLLEEVEPEGGGVLRGAALSELIPVGATLG